MGEHTRNSSSVNAGNRSAIHPPSNAGFPGNPRLAAALDYLARGWPIIPDCPETCDGRHAKRKPHPPEKAGKVPLVNDFLYYADHLPSPDQLRTWWQTWPNANLGMPLGGKRRWAAWDIDDEECEALLRRLLPGGLPPTLTFRSGGGGYRYFYLWPSDYLLPTFHQPTKHHPLSFLGDGQQTVLPPSGHISGKPYEWLPGRGPGEIEIAPATREMCELVRTWEQKKRGPGGGMVGPRGTGGADDNWLVRAEKWAQGFEPAIQGEGGSGVIWPLACSLVHRYHLSDEQAIRVMWDYWNRRCKPPWSEAEIRRTVERARARGSFDPLKEKPARPATARPATANGKPATSKPNRNGDSSNSPLINSAILSPQRESRDAEAVEEEALKVCSAASIVPGKPQPFWAPYFFRGQIVLVTGRGGTGKSSLLCFLTTLARRTLYFTGFEEDVPGVVIPRLRAHGANLDTIGIVEGRKCVLPNGAATLTKHALADKIDLVLFDPINSYFDDGLTFEREKDVRSVLDALGGVGKETGALVVGVCHSGKKDDNVLKGSTTYRDVARSVVELIHDDTPPGRRYLRSEKNSLVPGIADRCFTLGDGQGGPSVFKLLDEADPVDVALARSAQDPFQKGKRQLAREFLKQKLAAGMVAVEVLYKAAEARKLADRTLDRAKKDEGVEARPGKGDHAGGWFWCYPDKWPPTMKE